PSVPQTSSLQPPPPSLSPNSSPASIVLSLPPPSPTQQVPVAHEPFALPFGPITRPPLPPTPSLAPIVSSLPPPSPTQQVPAAREPLAFPFGPITCPDGSAFEFPDNLFGDALVSPTTAAPSSRSGSPGWDDALLTSFLSRKPEPTPKPPTPAKKTQAPRKSKARGGKKPVEEAVRADMGRGCRARKAPTKEVHTLTTDENGVQTTDAYGNAVKVTKRESQKDNARPTKHAR
ncbi:hypothetical protein DXG01_010848, partial [Tephrocybe rancida]